MLKSLDQINIMRVFETLQSQEKYIMKSVFYYCTISNKVNFKDDRKPN